MGLNGGLRMALYVKDNILNIFSFVLRQYWNEKRINSDSDSIHGDNVIILVIIKLYWVIFACQTAYWIFTC